MAHRSASWHHGPAIGGGDAIDPRLLSAKALSRTEVPARSVPAACALVTRDYLPYARVLAESYHAHHPGGRFYLLVLDGLPSGANVGGDIHLVAPADLACAHYWEMCVRYNALELSCAVKPLLVAALLEK